MNEELGDRMKLYEEAARSVLPKRLPLIIRVDGKAFHTYTGSLKKERGEPFNRKFIHVMETAASALCKEIQGAQLAYVQSDEISLLVHGYKTFSTQPWFGNQVQKMCSVAASVASSTFTAHSWKIWSSPKEDVTIEDHIVPAVFDARVFVLPEAEVCNYFIWRQQDAIRNSVQALARSLYSHRECDKKNVTQLRDMCASAEVPWESLPPSQRHGRCLKRRLIATENAVRSEWIVDTDIPVFTLNRDYINQHLSLEEE